MPFMHVRIESKQMYDQTKEIDSEWRKEKEVKKQQSVTDSSHMLYTCSF